MFRDKRSDLVAVLLAAGVGRRLGDEHDGPKTLLTFGGASLLRRHVSALYANSVRRLSITVGFEADRLREAAAALLSSGAFPDFQIEFVENPDYRQGSLVSLQVQAAHLRSGDAVLLMDGDVLYDPRMIARLLAGTAEGVLLVDREIEPGDEPVKVCFGEGGAIVDFRKRPERPHVWFGESVGFFRFSPAVAAALADRCTDYVDQGRVECEYEEAIRDLILAEPHRFGAEDVSDLPWTEIDFPHDVAKARDVVLPQLRD